MYRFSFCSPPPPSFSLLAVCASCEEKKNILPINERVPRHLTQLKPFIIIWTCSSWSRGEREIYTYKTMSVAHADGIKPYYDGKIQTLRVSVCMFLFYIFIYPYPSLTKKVKECLYCKKVVTVLECTHPFCLRCMKRIKQCCVCSLGRGLLVRSLVFVLESTLWLLRMHFHWSNIELNTERWALLSFVLSLLLLRLRLLGGGCRQGEKLAAVGSTTERVERKR